jgi:hypothetical protein
MLSWREKSFTKKLTTGRRFCIVAHVSNRVQQSLASYLVEGPFDLPSRTLLATPFATGVSAIAF